MAASPHPETSCIIREKKVHLFSASLAFFSNGLLSLSWWQTLLVTLVLTHVTIISVTVYLHRCQAHRTLDLHPVVSHFFRFWLWMAPGVRLLVVLSDSYRHGPGAVKSG
jgi:stearoyl-CoA desaturase (Delta-9 desaturase)